MDHSVWVLPRRHFDRHGFNVLAVDLPGHGRSDGPALGSVEAMADWLLELIAELDLQGVSLVGHSLGSLIALRSAALNLPCLRSVVLLGCIAPMPVSTVLLQAAKEQPEVGFAMVNTWGHSRGAQLGGNETPGMWMMGSGYQLLKRSPPGVLFSDLNACNQYQQGLDDAASITLPVLLLQGQQDVMTPIRASQGLREKLRHLSTVPVADCGHAIMSEQPEILLDCLVEFLCD